MGSNKKKSKDEWQAKLSPNVFEVTRNGGTERAFTGEYYQCTESGTYACACCDSELFSSDTKYDSGSGWPSFYAAINPEAIIEKVDASHGMSRTEILCRACDAHLGHVFPDGPQPTGLRFCVNSASLSLNKKD